MSLPRTNRLLRSSEFRQVYQAGIRTSSRYFAAFCLRSTGTPDQPIRIGFTLPRAVGKATVRNRIRRRMREAVRAQLGPMQNNWVIVFNPRRAVMDAPFEDLCRETARVIERCNERS